MATVKSYDDIVNAEVDAIQKQIDKAREARSGISKKIKDHEAERRRLSGRSEQLKKSLEHAKKESTRLKRFIWLSDNPNIVELRNQILLAAKLIIDQPKS